MSVEEIGFDFKNLTVDTVKADLDELKQRITETLNNIVSVKEQRTFLNTIQPLISVHTLNQEKKNGTYYGHNFYPDKELREVCNDVDKDFKNFLIDCSQRKDVYEACKEYEQRNYQKEQNSLTHEERRYISHLIRDFRREGLHLNDDEFIQMKKKLSDLSSDFSNNINEENTSFEFTRGHLEGLPESWFNKERLIKDAPNPNDEVYKVTLKYPDYVPAQEYVKDSSIRHILYAAYSSRCQDKNVAIFEEACLLRYKLAQKLGYETHADFKTEVQIVKTAENAVNFETNLNKMFDPLLEKEMTAITEFAQNYTDNPFKSNTLEPWDRSYYMRCYKEKVCDLDLNEVKQYFPLNTVREGLFHIYQTLLNLVFTEIKTENKWHDDVQLFSVRDKTSNELIGYFYLDMHPREGKFSHAAAFDFRNGYDALKITGENKRVPHIVTMACNFPKNECISFSDVQTFFHEFGHVMHLICSRTQIFFFCGFGVEGDFVEAPSQMLEHWCYCKESLQLMSSHEKTGEKIPETIVNKLKEMKTVLTAYINKRQLIYGIFDLRAHMTKFDDDSVKLNSQKIWYETEFEVLGIKSTELYNPVSAFGHMMGGYDAMYYGYLRAETYAANMFYKWFKDGHVLDPVVGMRYRKKLLEPGSTKDGIELLTDFLGEAPDDKYFLIDQGLSAMETD